MSDNPFLKGKVPARYIAEHEVILANFGGPYFDASGKMLENLRLRKGDTLYITEGEARGESWLHDPKRERESVYLGTGKRIPDDPLYSGKSEEELRALGWDYHALRSDFQEIVIPPVAPAKSSPPQKDKEEVK